MFLIGMPLVYIARWFVTAHASSVWLAVELAALPLFGTLAWLGLRRSPFYLAAGIAAHGVAWDAWHHGSSYIPSWYATGCLLVDLSLAGYVAARAAAWRGASVMTAPGAATGP